MKSYSTTQECPGKAGFGCYNTFITWIAAACNGYVVILEKMPDGILRLVRNDSGCALHTAHSLQRMLDTRLGLGRIIIIGAPSDIAWLHFILPQKQSKQIAAEIQHPLNPGLFAEKDFSGLVSSISELLS